MSTEAVHLGPAELVDRSDARSDEILNRAVAAFLLGYGVKSTRDAYRHSLEQWVTFCRSRFVDPLHAERAHVEGWQRTLEGENLAKSTIANKLNALSGFYQQAHADGLVARNPMVGVRRPQIPRESTRQGLTRPEFADLVTAAKAGSAQDLALVRLLGFNGLRVKEALGIDIAHIVAEQGETVVNITRKYGKVAAVPLAPRTAWVVAQLIGNRTAGPLFRSAYGNRLDTHGANRIIKRLVKAAGIRKHITCHSLRHSFVTMCRAAGVPDAEIIASTGHADVRMTDYYDRRSKIELARNATASIDAFVERAL